MSTSSGSAQVCPCRRQVSLLQTPDQIRIGTGIKRRFYSSASETISSADAEGSEETLTVEKWNAAIQAIQEATRGAAPLSPSFDASQPSIFQEYWRNVFLRLRETVSADSAIPKYLTEPPVRKFTITLFDDMTGLACPCCHPEVEPNIVLENDSGVTKEDLVDGIANVLYGDRLPRVYIEPDPLIHDEDEEVKEIDQNEDDDIDRDGEYQDDDGVVIYDSAWLRAADEVNGQPTTYTEVPNIVLYCCGRHEYSQKKREMEEMRDRVSRVDE